MRSRVRFAFRWLCEDATYLAGALPGVESLIGTGKELLGTVSHLVLLPTCRESYGKSEALPVHFQGTETSQH